MPRISKRILLWWVASAGALALLACAAETPDTGHSRGNAQAAGVSGGTPLPNGMAGAAGSAGLAGSAGSSGDAAGAGTAGTAGIAAGAGGAGTGAAGAGSQAPLPTAGAAGSSQPPPQGGSDAMPTAGAAAAGTGGDGMSVSGVPEAELEMLRQLCVDEINRYRATLSLPPVPRATPEHELCSDRGAQKDGDSGRAHSSAGRGNPCSTGPGSFPNFGSQNTCPRLQVGGFGAATLADALKRCLQQMWNEGEPPEGEEKCIADYRNMMPECFLAHGHYLNMKNATRGVSCGFYMFENNVYWGNQDFL
jgi:hypothetical protein